jgi:DNA-binding NarL/FixJ family response regulator
MIRVVVDDDHPALRAGLHAVIDAEPGIVFVGESAGDEESLWPLLQRARPDLLLLDYHLPGGDGLQLCYRIKRRLSAPRVLIYSAYASANLALAARLAQADGLIGKGLPARELFEAIRLGSRGELPLPAVSQTTRLELAERLEPDEQALVAMLLDGATEAEAAAVTRSSASDVQHAVQRILGRLRLEVPTADVGL